MKIGTTRVPILTARWGVHGVKSVNGVECAVRGPSGKWQVCSWPKGTLDLPKDDLYTHINLVTERPFNATSSSPANIGKPVRSILDQAVKGSYELRVRWYESDKPKKVREKVFSRQVT